MKKTLLFFLALTIFSSVSFASTLDNPVAVARMGVIRSGSVFKVFYKGTALNRVTINIYDSKGLLVFTDKLGKQENFVRPYNFSELADGQYTIELNDQLGKQVESVEYKHGKIEKLATLIKVAGESKFLLAVPSQGQDVLKVKITNESGDVVYEGEEKIQGDFARIYDLKSIGKFTMSVTDNKGTTKTIHY